MIFKQIEKYWSQKKKKNGSWKKKKKKKKKTNIFESFSGFKSTMEKREKRMSMPLNAHLINK